MEKGQLMILTGFLISVGMVIFIILVNNTIYVLNSPAMVDVSERNSIESLEYLIHKAVEDAVANASYTVLTQNVNNSAEAKEILENETKTFKRFFNIIEEYYGMDGKAINISILKLNCTAYNNSSKIILILDTDIDLYYKDEDLKLYRMLNVKVKSEVEL